MFSDHKWQFYHSRYQRVRDINSWHPRVRINSSLLLQLLLYTRVCGGYHNIYIFFLSCKYFLVVRPSPFRRTALGDDFTLGHTHTMSTDRFVQYYPLQTIVLLLAFLLFFFFFMRTIKILIYNGRRRGKRLTGVRFN